jgi:hypothetical protein
VSGGDGQQRRERLALLRQAVVGLDTVTRHFTGLEVIDEGATVLVEFAWRADPNRYAMRFGWDEDIPLMLMEELDTGAVYWAGTRRVAGRVELDVSARRVETPKGFYVAGVPCDNAAASVSARRLAGSGLNAAGTVEAAAAGELVSWIEAYVNNARGAPVVARAVTVWEPHAARVARIRQLEVTRRAPLELARVLLHHAVIDAAGEGAVRVVCDGRGAARPPLLETLGFAPPADTGPWSLETTMLP